MINDKRYYIGLEYTGALIQPHQHVVRFCGLRIGAANTLGEAQVLEAEHVSERGHDLVTRFNDGDSAVLWLKRGKIHRIAYGAEVTDTKNSVEAAEKFGLCVRHSLECAGKFD